MVAGELLNHGLDNTQQIVHHPNAMAMLPSIRASLHYEDINLIPQLKPGVVLDAKVQNEMSRVIVPPMESIVGETFAVRALQLGLSVCLPRFRSVDEQKQIFCAVKKQVSEDVFSRNLYVAVKVNDMKRVQALGHHKIIVDDLNGYAAEAIQFARTLVEEGKSVITANVCTQEGILAYPVGADVRVGIGLGSTSNSAVFNGVTRGAVTSILDCADRGEGRRIIADGGIKNPACAAKAFGLGANYVMMGYYFKRAFSAQNVLDQNYDYHGIESASQHFKTMGSIELPTEGYTIHYDKGDVCNIRTLVEDLCYGLSSAVNYSGFNTLHGFIGNGAFEINHPRE